jgi:hypothetical protein
MTMTWPKPGDHPHCCENGKGAITFRAAEGDDPRVRGDEGFAAWTIPFYAGGEMCLTTEIYFCPFCGRRLSGSWSDGKEAVERFVSLLPKQLGDACGPNSDLRFIAEALFAAFIEPIERRLEGGKLSSPGRLYENNVRDPEAPCEEFERGIPNGTPHDCDGDGHYLCAECVAWNGGRDG